MKSIGIAIGLATLVLGTASIAATAENPRLAATDRVRLAEAFRLADRLGNQLWAGWDRAPFAVLLISPEHEFLIRHPSPSRDFISLGRDSALGSLVHYRKRQFDIHFLATFPAVGGVPTIVIGQAESTEARRSTRWVVTLLHEHFHQLQYSQPGYIAGIDSLHLASGDTTGMWMLNYPFPYTRPDVVRLVAHLDSITVSALRSPSPNDFAQRASDYLAAKRALRAALSADEYRYFVFQLWQEGIARYTEYKVAAMAAEGYEPSPAFRDLPDFKPFADDA